MIATAIIGGLIMCLVGYFVGNIIGRNACEHAWEEKQRIDYPSCAQFLYICKKCGKMKKIKL